MKVAARDDAPTLCAVRAVRTWLDATEGKLGPGDPLFCKMRGSVVYREPMSLRTLDLLIKRIAKQAGLEGAFSTHSLRAGFATSAKSLGGDPYRIQQHLRHESMKTTKIYFRAEDELEDDPLMGKL
jgi:site-specific recombinase XerD